MMAALIKIHHKLFVSFAQPCAVFESFQRTICPLA